MKDKEKDKLLSKIEQLSLAFQPMVEVTTSGHTIKAHEILLRYRDGVFFPFQIFEELIASEESCNLLNQWYEQQISDCLETYPDTCFSLNIDFQQLLYPSTWDFLKSVSQYKQHLGIELTEFYQVTNSEHRALFLKAMNYIQDLGMKIAFDDVGNGQHSIVFVTENIQFVKSCKLSLLHFKHLEAETTALIIELWIKIAKEFNVHLVIEGVEDEAAAKMLCDKGVKYQQGFYWAEPISKKKILTA